MHSIRTLTPDTVARVRSGVVTALTCAVTELDPSLCESIPPGRYSIHIAGPSGILRRVHFRDRRASEPRSGAASLVLRFTDSAAMARLLGGGKGRVLPLPISLNFMKAGKAFTASSQRVGELTAKRTFVDEAEKRLVTELLMTAALRGVAETAAADFWTASKSSAMPDGTVEISVDGAHLSGWVRRSGESWTSGRGVPPAGPNARLTFADLDTAFGLFTGSVAALNALGRGALSIRGRVPMIQVLFPLLDRFGEIMSWGKPGEDAA
ncbi:MAG: hypothetical protein P1P77_10850 [Spirochaetaceae bacterium]|nr:hypothetical protein [Spirochaetaceae bacterium]